LKQSGVAGRKRTNSRTCITVHLKHVQGLYSSLGSTGTQKKRNGRARIHGGSIYIIAFRMLSPRGHRNGQQTSDNQPSQEEPNNTCPNDDLPLSPLDDRTQDLRQRGFKGWNGADLLEPQPNLFFLGRRLLKVFTLATFSSGDARRPRNGSID